MIILNAIKSFKFGSEVQSPYNFDDLSTDRYGNFNGETAWKSVQMKFLKKESKPRAGQQNLRVSLTH